MSGTAVRRTQADRRATTRAALLAAAARGLFTFGYAHLAVEQVAKDAGYTKGALYHLFGNKEELTLAVIDWVATTWEAEVHRPALDEGNPLDSLITMAKRHALYCRRDVARAGMMHTLQVEFAGQDHPVARAIGANVDQLESDVARAIAAGRRDGSIPPGPPARLTAGAVLYALESVGLRVAGRSPHDIELVTRAVRGILGLAPSDA